MSPSTTSNRRRIDAHGPVLWLAGLLVVVAVAAIGSTYASGQPDGLEKVAAEHGLDAAAEEHDLAGSPLADYGVSGVGDDRLPVGLAGVAGVAITLVFGGGLLWLVRRRRPAG